MSYECETHCPMAAFMFASFCQHIESQDMSIWPTCISVHVVHSSTKSRDEKTEQHGQQRILNCFVFGSGHILVHFLSSVSN